MSREIYLLRHAKAALSEPAWGGRDSVRPLTPSGWKKMRRVAQGMRALELSFDLILTSPYLRARQTAQIVAKAWRLEKELRTSAHLVPDGDPKKLIEELEHRHGSKRSVLLVGHEPSLGRILSTLTCGAASLSVAFKKAGLGKVVLAQAESNPRGTLEWLLTPGQLLILAQAG